MGVFRLWKFIKLCNWFVLFCMCVIFPLKYPRQINKQNPSDLHTLSANCPISLFSFYHSQLLEFSLLTASISSLSTHSSTHSNLAFCSHNSPKTAFTKITMASHVKSNGKFSVFNLLHFPAVFNTSDHFLIFWNILFPWILWHNDLTVFFLPLWLLHLCLLIVLYPDTKCSRFPEGSALGFLYSFYTLPLSDLIYFHEFQHTLYPNSQVTEVYQTSLSSYSYIQLPNLHRHLNVSQTSQISLV